MPRADTDPRPNQRIAKRIARSGLCSRRDAERLIAEGRVAVNGQVIATPATLVDDAAAITVDGEPLTAAEPTRLWRYHKPPGLMVTRHDPQNRPTVFDALPAELGGAIAVGRLDLNSEGLLLFTNDGALARYLELPATGWLRRYRVRVFGAVDPARLAALSKGVQVGEIVYGPIAARLDHAGPTNSWLTVSMREGRNREIRRVMEHLGLTVSRLIRVGYGPFLLGALARGAVASVPAKVLAGHLKGDWAAVSRKPARLPKLYGGQAGATSGKGGRDLPGKTGRHAGHRR